MSMSMLGDRRGDLLVFTEDVLSAIKVSRIVPAVPIYGSSVPLELVLRGLESFKSFKLWLDPDKRKESIKQCLNLRQKGIDISPVFSNNDPKEEEMETIKEEVK